MLPLTDRRAGMISTGDRRSAGDQGLTPLGDFHAALKQWRIRTIHVLLPVLAAFIFPYILQTILSKKLSSLPVVNGLVVCVYLIQLFLAFYRRIDYRIRVWSSLIPMYALAILSLFLYGLSGGGRILLLSLPLTITILLGHIAGAASLLFSLCAYAVAAYYVAGPPQRHASFLIDSPAAPPFWILQGLLLAGFLIPLFLLLIRFQKHHNDLMLQERQATETLQREMEARLRLDRALMEVQERERQRAGGEIHDGVCQQLLGAKLLLKVLEKEVEEVCPDRTPPHMRALKETVDTALKEAHDISKGLTPGDMPADALVPALRDIAHRTRELFEIECLLRGNADFSFLSREGIMHLYRIVQEGVANAIKHANASRILLTLEDTPGCVILRVEDDGIGIDNGKAPGPESLGLSIMHARAGALGGQLRIGPGTEGAGTILECSVPRNQRGGEIL